MKKEFLTLIAFLATKSITQESFDGMPAEEQAKIFNELNENNSEAIKEMQKALEAKKEGITKEELDAKLDEFRALQAEQMKALNESIIQVGLEAKSRTENPATGKGEAKTLYGALEMALKSVEGEIKACIDNNGKQTAAIKAVVTMQVDNTIGSGATQVTITDDTGLISPYRRRELRYMANVSVGRTSGNRALWIEQTAEDGTPIMLGEGDAKTQLSSIWQEKTASVKKIAVYGKVTTELMADIPQLISYIQNDLIKRMDIALENQLFNGNNTGDNLNGAFNLATAFNAGTLAYSIDNANDYDVIEAVALQTQLALGEPNAIFVNPAVVSRMKLTKGTDGHYVMPVFATANGLNVANMRVIPTTAVTGENFLGGDLTTLRVLIREELGIQIGRDGSDFTENKKTMLLEKRLVQYASANDVATLIKGDFTTAKAALETS